MPWDANRGQVAADRRGYAREEFCSRCPLNFCKLSYATFNLTEESEAACTADRCVRALVPIVLALRYSTSAQDSSSRT